MTYRTAIQAQIIALQQIYDNCGGLRDAATSEEKDAWNKMRSGLLQLWPQLESLDNSLTKERASTLLTGNYTVSVKF